jgi:hypothetical protein
VPAVLFSALLTFGSDTYTLNYRLSQAEIKDLIADCRPSLLIYSKAQIINFETVQMPCYTVSRFSCYFKREEKAILLKRNKESNPLFLFLLQEQLEYQAFVYQ